MKEDCGVLGIWARDGDVEKDGDVAKNAYFGLMQIQHRGQESAGIVTSKNGQLFCQLGMGTVDQVFSAAIPEEKLVEEIVNLQQKGVPQEEMVRYLKENKTVLRESVFARLKGNRAIGHVRYSTTGASMILNIQPMLGWFRGRQFAVGHNGNLVRIQKLKEECVGRGYQFRTTTDTEVIVALLATSQKKDFVEALREVLPRLDGSFSLTIIFENMVIGVRDAVGNRPLCWGVKGGTYIIASETCVLDVLGATLVDEVSPGELIVFQDGKYEKSVWAVNPSLRGLCLFEFIYFARPDSIIKGVTLYKAREKMGILLAQEHSSPLADLVISTPDSANPGAFGYAIGSKLPMTTYGLFRAHTVGRTFMEPVVEARKAFQRLKFNPITAVVRGKRPVEVDDSIVRLNVLPQVLRLLWQAGIVAIDFRIHSPPIRFPCHLGVDIPTFEELARIRHKTDEDIIQNLRIETGFKGEITLGHLSLNSTIEATTLPEEIFCTGCFTGRYPVDPPKDLQLIKPPPC